MKLLSSLFTFVIIFSVFALQAQKNINKKQGNKKNMPVDTTIITDNTAEKVEEEKPKKPKLTDQILLDRLNRIENQLIALQGILVDCDSIPDMSPYMLRSEHTATVNILNELQNSLKIKEIQYTEAKSKLNAELSDQRSKINSLTRERDEYSRKYLDEEKVSGEKQKEIDAAKNALDNEHKANQKITNDLTVVFLKQETADLAMVKKMIALDKKLNSSKHLNDLNDFNDIQELIVQGREILNKALNTAEITKYKSDVQAKSILKTKYAKSFVVISEITDQIEDYIEMTCRIQRKVNVILGSKLNAEQKKDRLAKRVIDEDDLEYVKSNFSYLYKEIEHTKKTMQWRIRFQCN